MNVTRSGLSHLVELIQTNTPANKPQLWEDLGYSARRRFMFIASALRAPGWLDGPQLVRLRDRDIVMEAVPREFIARNIFMYGIWEIVGTRLIEALLRPDMCFIDVGANIGYYSLLAADLVGPEGHVYSFEPHERIRQQLQRNVELIHLGNVYVRAEAVADRSGAIDFYRVNQVDGNLGLSSILPGKRTEQIPVSVPSITLDEFAGSLPVGRMDVLKIDVEGAESEVLAGAQELLSSPLAPHAILLESTNIAAHAALLAAHGYGVMGVHYSLRNGLEFVQPEDAAAIFHLRRFFRGQATFDYLALKKANAAAASFESLRGHRRHRPRG